MQFTFHPASRLSITITQNDLLLLLCQKERNQCSPFENKIIYLAFILSLDLGQTQQGATKG